jgi:pyrroline-5-carboxylate reductase
MGRIGFIGAGNMAAAIMGCLSKEYEMMASRRSVNALRALGERYAISTTTDNIELASSCDIVFICVKPQSAEGLMKELADVDFSNKLVVSILAGKRISFFTERLTNCSRVVRAMPNLGLLVEKGATAYAVSDACTPEDEYKAHILLNAGAYAVKVDEEEIDTITAVSGCGPAFISYFLKSLEDAAIHHGLSKDIAQKLLFQTVLGTCEYLRTSDLDYDGFISKVASKGGATRAGIDAGRREGVDESIRAMVDAAIARARELGK